jgi:RNA polymerase sigma-70 factor (ECF subfamily)
MKIRVSPDEELMTGLCTEHHAALLRFVSRSVRDGDKAGDLVQETLLQAWKNIDHLDAEPGRSRSYLLTIAEAPERLSPDHQAVVRTLYFEDRSVAGAARRLSVLEGAVKSRACYTVRALRAAFDEMGVPR